MLRSNEVLESDAGPCRGCGACCTSGMKMELTNAEVEQLAGAGTVLRRLSVSECLGREPGPGKEYWQLTSDCGNLDPQTRRCTIYNSRPEACRDYTVNSLGCQAMRVDLGMPVLEQGIDTI